jgi:hypothetical protein
VYLHLLHAATSMQPLPCRPFCMQHSMCGSMTHSARRPYSSVKGPARVTKLTTRNVVQNWGRLFSPVWPWRIHRVRASRDPRIRCDTNSIHSRTASASNLLHTNHEWRLTAPITSSSQILTIHPAGASTSLSSRGIHLNGKPLQYWPVKPHPQCTPQCPAHRKVHPAGPLDIRGAATPLIAYSMRQVSIKLGWPV